MTPILRQLDRLDRVLIVPAYPLGGRGQQAAQESTRRTPAPWAAAPSGCNRSRDEKNPRAAATAGG